ncbi:bacteriohemerythrin [Suttonella sp. R2A3]|uniref:bacteriohemerythrin n=1 Tax=Suttonella sp. R2A3 TaxID=2908648 RepID=UPI001F216892|nr:bacteriohemerythrin [Suttonella sp. R2A3]UJF23654.1 bacteriohemerythrin [Suttonella sp. R2A3]
MALPRTFIEWDDRFSIKVEDIDYQHQELVNIMNRLYQAIVDRTAQSEGPKILDDLKIYTIAHFSVEESLMRIFGYEDYEVHKEQHRQLVEELQEVMLRVEAGEHHINSDLLIYLRKWLVNHIMHTDVKLGRFLIEQGIGKNKPWYKRIFS